MGFPTPQEVDSRTEASENKTGDEVETYLGKVADALRAGLKFESDGWAYVRNPRLPSYFTTGTAAWTRMQTIVGRAGWEIDLWEGHPRDAEHTLRIKRR